jgi:hypothetical protein
MKMNWTKKQTQWYGAFCGLLGLLIGITGTIFTQQILKCF